ncbi:MAG: peptidylprolyl isomerase [Bacteroidales bacterium]|nr:peptidylprolyl isomerase [Bacteroidales bacterium]
MKAEKNKVVAVSYQLEVEGKIADQSAPGNPLEYIHGSGMLLPKFEGAIEGKEPGESFDFILSPEDGYGTYDPKYLVELPKTAFAIDGQVREDLLVVGRTIPMLNQAGQVVQGTVSKVTDSTVTMDFNHPMAGKTLHFTGKVESVRSATDKELTEGLHGEYLPQEEGCGGCGGGGCHKENGECCGKEGCDCK